MFRRSLQQVPIWVWTGLAVVQFLLLPYTLQLLAIPEEQLYAHQREDRYWRVGVMAVCVPLFLGLSIWRWWVGSPRSTSVS